MDPQAFAAERAERLKSGDDFLRAFVLEGLDAYAKGQDDWSDVVVEAASQIWLENYQAEAPGRAYSRPLARFRTDLADYLDKTEQPEGAVENSQVDRITRWLSTYATNAGTTTGAFGRGIKFKRWTTMHDEDVREIHVGMDGQVRPIGGTFMVEGTKLPYPGAPVGPPEVWINCRCVLMPASKEGEAMSATTYTIGPEDAIEDDNPDIIPGSDIIMAAAVIDEEDIAVEPADEAELPDTDEVETDEVAVHGVLAPEGVATGDGREFAIGALSTRNLPVPLRYEIVGSHGGDTSQVVTVGRVDEAWRNDETDEWEFKGVVILSKPHADEALAGIRDGSGRGVSIDGDDAEVQIQEMSEDDEIDIMEALFGPSKTIFSKMRVAGLTIVAIPAFQEAYIAEGHDFREVSTDERKKLADEGAAMPDGSYPIASCEDLSNAIQSIGRASDPEATKAHIKKRKAQLGCDEVELPEDWGAMLIASAVARLVEAEATVYPGSWFSNPSLGRAVPLRIEPETGRVYGYVAEWGVCHVGMAGMCQEVPPSTSGYAYYLKGLVDTDEGEQPVGVLSFGGHASGRDSMARASDYYDKPDAVRAYVNVGEDEFGVWFAGVVAPGTTDAQIAEMRAIGAVSGDWREVRGQLELIGVPIVNTPGFPVRALTASAGKQISLIGAGALKPEFELEGVGVIEAFEFPTVQEIISGVMRQQKLAARAQSARATVNRERLADARARIGRI
jgi:hypothetical protein